jgi:hypothetical protein
MLMLAIPLTACTQSVDPAPAAAGATEAPIAVQDGAPTIVNGALLQPALVLEYPDKLRITFYVTDSGTFSISETGTVGSEPRLTESLTALADPVKIAQALAPDVTIPDALRTGFSVPREDRGLSDSATTWLLSQGSTLSDIMGMQQGAAASANGPAPASAAAPVEKVREAPRSPCIYTNYFQSATALEHYYLCYPGSVGANVLCMNYDNYVIAAMNDQGDTKGFTFDVHESCVFSEHTWLGYYPLAAGYWQRAWVLGIGGFGCTKTFGIGTIGGNASDTGYEHLGYSCY